MPGEDYKFQGWMGLGPESADGKMVWQEFPDNRKPFEENDVDIKITHAGICGSDLHTLRSGWGPTPYVRFSLCFQWLGERPMLTIMFPTARLRRPRNRRYSRACR